MLRHDDMFRWISCLVALVLSATLSQAAGDARAQEVVELLAGRFRAMKAYTVIFEVQGADFATEGSYAVEGDRYYMRVGDAEAYSDGESKWEIDPVKREVVVDVVDRSSRSLLNNPTRAFDFLGDAFVSELLPSENGLYRLQLTPADKGAVMSAVTVEVAADGTPHAVVYDLDGDTLRIDIRRIASSADVKRFDAGAYPGYETIDFR